MTDHTEELALWRPGLDVHGVSVAVEDWTPDQSVKRHWSDDKDAGEVVTLTKGDHRVAVYFDPTPRLTTPLSEAIDTAYTELMQRCGMPRDITGRR